MQTAAGLLQEAGWGLGAWGSGVKKHLGGLMAASRGSHPLNKIRRGQGRDRANRLHSYRVTPWDGGVGLGL